MSAKPPMIHGHPVSYLEAMERGMFRGVVDMSPGDDGDTLGIQCDIGLGHYPYERFRIKDLRCAERRSRSEQEKEAGEDAYQAAFTAAEGTWCLIRTSKTRDRDRKTFSRFVADVLILNADGSETDFATLMKELGHHGKGK